MSAAPRGQLVLASGNAGKLAEMREILSGLGFELCAQSEFGIEPPEETGDTLLANALLKARFAAERTGLPVLADDSGLEVDALDGRPGVYSARYAGPGCSDADNNRLLLAELQDVPAGRRSARFRSVIVYLGHARDPEPRVAEGVWEGSIGFGLRGSMGFGYDPLFLPAGDTRTAAELPAAEKNLLSHRGQSLAALIRLLKAG